MITPSRFLSICVALLFCSIVVAQQTPSSQPGLVPRLVNFSGRALDDTGKAIPGVIGIRFAIYKDQYDGASLWMETQNVQPDAKGNYTIQLGATRPEGLPLDLFTSGEARWLGVSINGAEEQPRILLLSVPYALKAADAETVGGLPASAFVLAAPPSSGVPLSQSQVGTATASVPPPTTSNVTTSGGTVNALPLWTTATNIQTSMLTQSGTGTTAKLGVNTTTPASTLDVKGTETVRGNLSLPATANATATGGKNSQPATFTASVFNSTTGSAVTQNFRWQAEPVANNTASASGSLNLLYGAGGNAISETGLHISGSGQITFAKGQTFPGTVGSVGFTAPATDFTVSGSPITGSGTLALSWNVVPTTSDTANAIVKRDSNGSFSAGAITGTLGVEGETATNCSGCAGVSGVNTGGGNGIYGVTSGNAAAILGQNSATSGALADGVDGVSASASASGVAGINNVGGVGVYGSSPIGGTGVQGVAANGGTGVYGTSDFGNAGFFQNGNGSVALVAWSNGSGPFAAWNIAVSPSAGCYIDYLGNINCTGSKNAVVPLNGGTRKVALSAIESPQNWFEDFGSARLVNGVAVVQLDSDFLQTVNTEREYNVFLTPYGDCKGLYVAHRNATSFEVHEVGGGSASISFGYRIAAIRRRYETVRFADHTNDPSPTTMRVPGQRLKSSSAVSRPAQPAANKPVAQLVHP